jgi:MoaA/NifB/PqqE/SkfB family radical SAM enzyme
MIEAAAKPRKTCHLGWHITSRCNLSCRHCLRRTPGQATTDLAREECRAVLASYLEFAENNDRAASIQFSGGNPLLRDDFPDLLMTAAEAKMRGTINRIQILGNPETLDDNMANLLAECKVDDITISLDGLEEANDRMRGSGNFRAALAAIRRLVKAGVPVSVKFTLTRGNSDQVMPVIRLALEEGVKQVGIGQLILAGGGYEVRDQRLAPLEYREFLLEMLRELESLPEEHADFRRSFIRHNGMYALLFHELGRLEEFRNINTTRSHRINSDGGVMFVVWSDGEVVPRRELQRQGYVPRNTFQEIYDSSPLLKMLEDKARLRELAEETQRSLVKCSACPVAEFCRPGMVGVFGSHPYFAANRNCWR